MSVFAWADQGKYCMSVDSSRSDSSASMSVSQILAVIHRDDVMQGISQNLTPVSLFFPYKTSAITPVA